MDVKYGVERLFATDVITGGPSRTSLRASGTRRATRARTRAVTCGHDRQATANTITFNLSGAERRLQLPDGDGCVGSGAVQDREHPGYKGATYTKHPMATGPFMIKSYSRRQVHRLVRNPNWSQSTDTIRHPLVNEVDLTIDTSPEDMDSKLEAGTAGRERRRGTACITPEFKSKVLTDPTLKKNADDPVAPFDPVLAW